MFNLRGLQEKKPRYRENPKLQYIKEYSSMGNYVPCTACHIPQDVKDPKLDSGSNN